MKQTAEDEGGQAKVKTSSAAILYKAIFSISDYYFIAIIAYC